MAKEKKPWTSNEVKALTDGVKRHGEGKWKVILGDPLYGSSLSNRSNVDLKDKWRNLGGSKHGGSSEKRKAPVYDRMIYEALSAFRDPNGTDVDSIDNYLQREYNVPEKCRRFLTGKLNTLTVAGKLEKVNERYRVKRREATQEGNDAIAVAVDNRNNEQAGPQNRIGLQQPLEPQNVSQRRVLDFDLNELPVETGEPVPTERLEDAASGAAAQIATAKPLESRAIKGYEDHKNKLAELLDESAAMLKRAEDLYDQCRRNGKAILPP